MQTYFSALSPPDAYLHFHHLRTILTLRASIAWAGTAAIQLFFLGKRCNVHTWVVHPPEEEGV